MKIVGATSVVQFEMSGTTAVGMEAVLLAMLSQKSLHTHPGKKK
jgi:hypothetical protein